ncbi:prepilin-type N-terminal cleavage/methylation domain-containing protein [Pelagibacteraceae bacterium]|nr:prepilin-type N-terminal cleavage/methylation domain-containing protein [Pelagibacteraceae bacterium]
MKNRNSGFTLAEVLVSIVIGVISIAAAFASYNYFNKSYKSVSQKAAINSSAREALTVIARDLRNAGYIDINFTRDARPEIRLINLRQKYLGNLDSLAVWYTASPNDRMRVYYRPMKYRNSNKMYLAREVVMNPVTVGTVIYDNIEFVPNIVDFQVVFRDKDGNELYPVCAYCGPVENSQGSNQMVGSYNKGQANMKKVHTAEIYLTIESAKEVFNKNQATRIINHENGQYGNTLNFNDKYYRETFFASVHTRNLAKHVAITEQTGTSISQSSTYNK